MCITRNSIALAGAFVMDVGDYSQGVPRSTQVDHMWQVSGWVAK